MSGKTLWGFIWFWLLVIPLSFNVWGLDPALYSKFLLLDVSLLIAAGWLEVKPVGQYSISRSAGLFFLLYSVYGFLSVVGLWHYHINEADGWFEWMNIFIF